MNLNHSSFPWLARLAAALLVAALPAARLAADTPPPPSPPAPPAAVPGNRDDSEAQLEDARKRLEEAAREVARLSEQMSTSVMDQVMPYVSTGHAIIGVQLEAGEDKGGARIHAVSPGGPAAEAGLRANDVIVAINGTSVAGAEPARHVTRILRDVEPDSHVRVRVLRDGEPREFVVTARRGPALLPDVLPELALAIKDGPGAYLFHRPLMDMELATLTPQLGSYFGTDKGVLVVRAPAGGSLKLEDGDVILAIDGRVPSSGSHATRILASYQPGEKITLRIMRQHKRLELEATLPEQPGAASHGAQRERDAQPAAPRPHTVLFGDEAA